MTDKLSAGTALYDDPKTEIYVQYRDKVTAYVRKKVSDPHEVEDIVSNVFLRVYEKYDMFDPSRASISTWIYTITHNIVVDYYRSRRVHTEYADYMDPSIDEIAADDCDDDQLQLLAEALSTLNQKQKDLIVLRYYKGYTLKRVAELMGMSYANAKLIHAKALLQLRAQMQN